MDRDIADRMRCENFEQFQTLVRMHLSFELDLNTDTVDNEPVHNVKLRSKKLFAFPKKSKHLHSTSSKNPPFNVAHTLTSVGIEQVKQMISFLMQDNNIIQEGIFRRTGSVARQNELRRRLNEGNKLDFSDGVYTVHDCASVLKAIIADLPEPLLTDNFYVVHSQIAELCNSNLIEFNQTKETRLLHSIQLLLLLLPLENRSLFHDIINMLYETTQYESSNKMSSESLATLFTPHLICPRKLSPEALHSISQNMSALVSFMISKGEQLQNIPPKLATDIRAYFLEQKRKKIMSPELQMLDESVTSDSTANTVYTFVDREKTAEAHDSNPTDTALAQLYAYIQTLPESSKKRKLIKQFNKENGQGTPLQQQIMMRLKKANAPTQRPNKSISGSIKKHIFHSTLGSKTPKRRSIVISSPAAAASTPIIRKDFDTSHRPRLVFQTPVQSRLCADHAILTPVIDTILESQTPTSTNTATSHFVSPSLKIDHYNIENVTTNKDSIELNNSKYHKNDNDNDKYLTPAMFNMNRFVMCFRSEPDLSKAQTGKHENVPMLNRGRFIAKKLLSGVSMSNLRRPFSAHNEKTNAKKSDDLTPKTSRDFLTNKESIKFKIISDDTNMDDNDFKKIEEEKLNAFFDEDERKENQLPGEGLLRRKSTEYIPKTRQLCSAIVSCSGTLSDSMAGDSVSPITKSTHRMSKAMQESIMTPRSRKPVIIGAMRDMATDNYHKNFMEFQFDNEEIDDNDDGDENDYEIGKAKSPSINTSLQKSKSESSLTPTRSQNCSKALLETVEAQAIKMANSTSDETLSTPFRQYLFSRSLLMTTPVDSSFSSQSDDFENLNDSEMSESLIYCLNGNEPVEYVDSDSEMTKIPIATTPMTAGRRYVSNISNSIGFSIKRTHKNDNPSEGSSLGDHFCGEINSIIAKKNHVELDETAL